MYILAIIFMGGMVQAHKAKGVDFGHKGVGTWDEKGRFYNRTRWDHGGGHVLLGSGTQLCWLVLSNEDESRHHMQGCHALDRKIDLKKIVVLL